MQCSPKYCAPSVCRTNLHVGDAFGMCGLAGHKLGLQLSRLVSGARRIGTGSHDGRGGMLVAADLQLGVQRRNVGAQGGADATLCLDQSQVTRVNLPEQVELLPGPSLRRKTILRQEY